MNCCSILCYCTLLLTMMGPMYAFGGQIYTPHERNKHLGIINPITGVGTDVGSFEQPEPGYRLLSNAFDPMGNMFSIAMLPGNTGHQLLSVDLATGVATKIAPTSDVPILGMEIDANDVMYAMQYVIPGTLEGDPILFNMDKSSGVLTPIGDTGVVRSMDLAFDVEGTLWLVGGPDGGNKLYTLDTSTGASTFVTDITGVEEATEPSIEIMGIMFDEHNNLYGTAFRPAPEPNDFLSPLFSIDTSTGAATVIGQTGLRLPHGGDYLVTERLEADFTGDGIVDFSDFLVLSSQFNQTVDPPGTGPDIDGSGTVDFPDFLVLSEQFNRTSGGVAAPVPEPSSGLLMGIWALCSTGVLRRRNRPSVSPMRIGGPLGE